MKSLKYNEVKLHDMEVVKVLHKGQIVIPKEFRDELRLEEGKKVLVERLNGGLILIPEPKNPLAAMRGLLKGISEESSVEAVKKLRRQSDKRVR